MVTSCCKSAVRSPHRTTDSPLLPCCNATVRPLYRKDVFYAGSVSHLIKESQNQQEPSQMNRKRSSGGGGGMISALPSYANFDEYRYVKNLVSKQPNKR